MKKLIAAVCAVLAATILLCACSQSKVKPLAQVFDSIKEQVTLSELNEFQFVSALDRYYGITSDEVVEFAGGINNSGVNQEEIVMIMASNTEAADHIQTVLENRRQAKYNENKNYNSEQAQMIDSCSVDRHGMYIAMFISENADKIREIYNTQLEF